jgi:uncharacterized protein YcbX
MHISRLYCYPIKSCGGVALDATHVSLRGIQHDRAWAVVDLKTRKILTQREAPKLCLIRADVVGDELHYWTNDADRQRTTVGASESKRIVRMTADIWGEKVEVEDQGIWSSGWFTAVLGRPCALVRLPEARRPKGRDINFADAYECLIISEASLEDLNSRLETPLQMDRFRPNIVVAGCEPYAEDGWGMIRLSGLHAEAGAPCVRCVITTTDQATGVRGKEPLRTLATYRKAEKGVTFGRNFSFMNGGCLRVGDPVEALETPP